MYTFGNKHGPPDAVEGTQCVAPVVGLKNRVLPNAVNHGVLIGKNNLPLRDLNEFAEQACEARPVRANLRAAAAKSMHR